MQGTDIDFKLATSPGAANEDCTVESAFDTLLVRCVEELVTLGPRASGAAAVANTGEHLSPQEFHAALRSASEGEVVLLDARNIYESRIGHFSAPAAETVLPGTRCFSDLPRWLDSQEAALRGKRVLMYCTGGVRCERASAYLREKGAGFENVLQLSGACFLTSTLSHTIACMQTGRRCLP